MRVKFTNFPKEYKSLKNKLIQKFEKIGSSGQYVLGNELKVFEKRIEKVFKSKTCPWCWKLDRRNRHGSKSTWL